MSQLSQIWCTHATHLTMHTLTTFAAVAVLAAYACPSRGEPIRMKPLGAYCGFADVSESCDESTPVLWNGKLTMVEHHSGQ